MGKKDKRDKVSKVCGRPFYMLLGRKEPIKDFKLFLHKFRQPSCLYRDNWHLLEIKKLNPQEIKSILALECKSIEHQIVKLRELTQLSQEDYQKRLDFTQNFLTCLRKHHNVIYEGILFGSTVNGLGFCDSDVDLRLRVLKQIDDNLFEPFALDEDMVDRTLRNIAYTTTRCSPTIGEFVPSTRCPVSKLTFLREPIMTHFKKYPDNLSNLQEGLKYDVSLGSDTPLGTFNSMFLRFLCNLQPKFHLLATVLRYWSSVHKLIVPGYLSSYALINMLILFCQTTEPPLLPTVDEMRNLYFKKFKNLNQFDEATNGTSCVNPELSYPKAITQIEWQCLVCLDKSFYPPCENNEHLSVLLLKFFEYYLKFPYSTHILTARPGRPLTHQEFKNSSQFHPRFSINRLLSIQDPFDPKHNLTSGMQGGHFEIMISTMYKSYEVLYEELNRNFFQPSFADDIVQELKINDYNNLPISKQQDANQMIDSRDWGLNRLFVRFKVEQQFKKKNIPPAAKQQNGLSTNNNS